jgi:hypothetical protein
MPRIKRMKHARNQRVLNDIERPRLSHGRMIWLLPHPLTPSPVSKLDRRHRGILRKRDSLVTGERGRRWGRSQIDGEKDWYHVNHSMFSARNAHTVGEEGAVKRRAGSGREGLEGWKGGPYPGVRRGD